LKQVIKLVCGPRLLQTCNLLHLRDKRSLEFTVTRSFMKLLRTIGRRCWWVPIFFRFLPVIYQIDIRTAKFLQIFMT